KLERDGLRPFRVRVVVDQYGESLLRLARGKAERARGARVVAALKSQARDRGAGDGDRRRAAVVGRVVNAHGARRVARPLDRDGDRAAALGDRVEGLRELDDG